jgi:preprotein translocase subunit SecY
MWNKIKQVFKIKEVRRKIFIVFGILFVFRILAAIPIPGIDADRLEALLGSSQLFGFLNIFSGSGLSNLSIVMLGVGPYITATIIMQLLTMIFPAMKRLYYEEGEAGRAKFNRYSRLITVPLAGMQGYGFLNLLINQQVLPPMGLAGQLNSVLIVVTGSMILMWLGELISEQKIGNGISLIIFAGIVSSIPQTIIQAFRTYTPSVLPTYIAFIAVSLVIIAGVVYVTEGERKIPVSYSKRVQGTKMYGGASSYLPLRINQAGVIPIIFAISILLFPQFFAQILAIFSPEFSIKIQTVVNSVLGNQIIYGLIYFVLVFAFTYFYTAVTFDPKEISKNLQRSGGFIPGIRPGEPSGEFLKKITSRITFFGALFLGAIAVLPIVTQIFTGIQILTIGGTALLIVVAVALETMKQIDSQLVLREYEGIR